MDRTRFEKDLFEEGRVRVAGVDEVGRGPLAGPVVAAAVILPPGLLIEGLRDSKKLTPGKRETLYEKITRSAVSFGLGIVDEQEIDRINILQSARRAMIQAIGRLNPSPDFLLIDGPTPLESTIPQRGLIGGDDRSQSIAAASVVAKVTRDRLMVEFHHEFPCYNFKSNKGYGTAEHIRALDLFGPCVIHRRSFRPVRIRALRAGGLPGPGEA